MYVCSQSLAGTSDIMELFSDDFFNSAAIYQLPITSDKEIETNYRVREDLLSSQAYGKSSLMGLIILSVGETVTKSEDSVVTIKGFEPQNTIKVKDIANLADMQLVNVENNTLSQKEINKVRKPYAEHFKLNSTGKFESID